MSGRIKKYWGIITTLDAIWSIIQHLGLPKIIISLAGGVGMGIWSYLSKIPMPVAVLIASLVFVIVIWAWNGITWRSEKKSLKPKVTSGLNGILKAEDQEGHEELWLRPVVEWIDLNREWLPSNEIIVQYQIDSGLRYPFKPVGVWCKLKLDEYETDEDYPLKQPIPNLIAGKRSQLASETVRIADKRLLDKIGEYRHGSKMKRRLKILVQLKQNGPKVVLEHSYDIDP